MKMNERGIMVGWGEVIVEDRGDFLDFFFMYVVQHCFICRPSDSTVSEDAGIEPRAVRRRH